MRTKLSVARASLQGTQDFDTSTSIAVGDLALGSELCYVLLDLPAAARLDPATFLECTFVASADGETWTPIGSMTFKGDPELEPTRPIGIGVFASAVIGQKVRARVRCPQRLSVGVSVQIGQPADLGLEG